MTLDYLDFDYSEDTEGVGVFDAMATTGRYQYLPGRELVGLSDHEVIDHRGEGHRGDQIWVCLGATLSGFAAELFESEPLRRVRLNMAETLPL